jgi:tRNA (guanine37-N1)-methyltransferase
VLAFEIITIFPEFFDGPLHHGIIRRARDRGLIDTRIHDLREHTTEAHNAVDDRPFGGGEGMVLKPEPIFRAVEALPRNGESREVVVLSAGGESLTQAEALRLSQATQIVLICGRYEGIDERVVDRLATKELSIGNYVVSGGEIAAAVILDAVTRYVPGAVGKEESILKDSFSDPRSIENLVEHPHYTRPAEFRGLRVPEVLLSGDHAAVAEWRRRASLKKTVKNRPDMINREALSEADLSSLEELNSTQSRNERNRPQSAPVPRI